MDKHDLRQLIVKNALSWKDTPFMHKQAIKGVGVDCIRLLESIAIESGINVIPIDDASRTKPRAQTIIQLEAALVRIPFSIVQPADIIHLSISEEYQHFTLVTRLNPIYIIHAYLPKPICKVVEHRLDSKWQRAIRGCYRLPELTE